jgi:hypothetical protein
MVLLFDAFTDHNANGSPTPWQDKYLSTEKEVKFGNKSESNLFQENRKILMIRPVTGSMTASEPYNIVAARLNMPPK